MVKALDCDSKNIGSSPIIYLMVYKFLKIFKKLRRWLKKNNHNNLELNVIGKEKGFFYFLEKPKVINIYNFPFFIKTIFSKDFKNFYKNILIKKFKKSLNFYFNFNYLFFFSIFRKHFTSNRYFCKLYQNQTQSIIISFPKNSRYKFIYENKLGKTLLTRSPGLLMKIFKLRKKSTRRRKKIFKLGLLEIKKKIKLKRNILFIFRGIHKNIFIYLKSIFKILKIKEQLYYFCFFFKKFNKYDRWKKKRSIARRFQRRLMRLSK